MGKCLTAFYTENTNTPVEGQNQQSFAQQTAGIVDQLGRSSMAVVLELLKHPIDAFFTYCIGVITGVQDVIQTIDMANCKLPDFYMQVSSLLFSRKQKQKSNPLSANRTSSSARAATGPSGSRARAPRKPTRTVPSGAPAR